MKIQIDKDVIEEALLSFQGYRRELAEINDGQPCDAEKKLRAALAASQAVEPTESVLIDGKAYTLPMPVACELLRLNLLIQAQAVEPEPVANSLENIAAYLGLGGFNGATPEKLEEYIKAEFDLISQRLKNTHPAPAKPLSDEQIEQAYSAASMPSDYYPHEELVSYARAIEAAHGIKETS